METFYYYSNDSPRTRIVCLRTTSVAHGASGDVVRLQMNPVQGNITLHYMGDFLSALRGCLSAYWFNITWRANQPVGLADVGVVSYIQPRTDHPWRGSGVYRQVRDPFSVDMPAVNWDTLLGFARLLPRTKFVQPVLDWMMEYMPEPWSLFPTDPLGLCRALCPFPLSGDYRVPSR